MKILTITGADGSGRSGVQADIQTITAMGGEALSAVTSIAIPQGDGSTEVHNLESRLVLAQVESIISQWHPKAIKIGLLNDADTTRELRQEIVACRHVVCDMGILGADNSRMADDDTIDALCRYIIPETELLMMKCSEAEVILQRSIKTEADMLSASRLLTEMGAKWVMLRGGRINQHSITALLYGAGSYEFFSSYNVEGWQQHGVRGALSTAIATRLAYGDDMPTAVRNAHDFIHCQVVYAVENNDKPQRPAFLYNQFLDIIAANITRMHDVVSYADSLAITPRYLTAVTKQIVNKPPKQIIDEYLAQETKILLTTTSLSVQQIAEQLGFSSPAIFSKFCRKQLGCSPTELRLSKK